MPTPQNVVDKMLDVAKIRKDDVLYDIGCGDGRIVINAAKRFGIKASRLRHRPEAGRGVAGEREEHKVEHLVTIEQKDIFTVDLSKATVVTLYLLPELNVASSRSSRSSPGSRIVSHDFDMEGVRAGEDVDRDRARPPQAEGPRALRLPVEDAAQEAFEHGFARSCHVGVAA